MNHTLVIILWVIAIVIVAFVLIFLATIPLYIWLIFRRNKFSKIAKDFNLSYESNLPNLFKLNPIFGKREYIVASVQGQVGSHQIKIHDVWQNTLFGGSSLPEGSDSLKNFVEIDGKKIDYKFSNLKNPSVSKIRSTIKNLVNKL